MKKFKKNLVFLLTLSISLVVAVSCGDDDVDYPPFSPTASISSQIDEENPLTVHFTSTTTNAETYLWDFGDGSTSTEMEPTYTYNVEGSYDVTLIVTGVEGSTPAEATRTITLKTLDKIEGESIIGHEGSWDGVNGLIATAFDGDLSTFVDAPGEFASTGYVGYDFGEGKAAMLEGVAFAPRSGFEGRLVNAEIRGSNDPSLSSYTTLYTISNQPTAGELTQVELSPDDSYRYVYFYTAPDGYANVAEIEFYGEVVDRVSTGGGDGNGGSDEFASLTVENFSFEQPADGKKTNWSEVPAWSSDEQASDSGVEEGRSTEGAWAAFLKNTDPSVYNLTGYTIQEGDELKLTMDIEDLYFGTDIKITLYYDTGDGNRNLIASEDFEVESGDWRAFEMTTTVSSEAVGAKLGIELENISAGDDNGEGWQRIDNVMLYAK